MGVDVYNGPLSPALVPFHSQAEVNLIAGACLSLGMRFAGTAHKEAFATLVRAQGGEGVWGKSMEEEVFGERAGRRRCLVGEQGGGSVW